MNIKETFALLVVVVVAGCSAGQRAQPTVTDRMVLQHVAAASAERELEPNAAGATIIADERSNALLISGSPEALQRVREAVEKIDRPS